MNDSIRSNAEHRVLILVPSGTDAELTVSIFERAGLKFSACPDLPALCRELDRGAGAVLIAEECVGPIQGTCLEAWLKQQPAWSDLPLLILARPGADSADVAQSMDLLGNVTVLERPIRVAALVSAVRAALRARQKQFQLRDDLIERERHIQTLAFQAAIVASSDDAIISKTLEGVILTWNEGAERLFGYTAEEAVGQPITLLIPPERQDEEPALLSRLRRGERIEHFETVRVTKAGNRIDISLTVSPVRDARGTIIGASKVARDITQRKQTEAALLEADRRKDEFLAVLAHELRNPLAPIRNSLHILSLAAQNDPNTKRVGEMIERQVNHLVRLVDDLLEVSRITRGKIELRREPIEIAAIVRSALETSQPLIEAAGHQFALSIPPEPLVVDGDPVRLTQIVANLLNNAAKYTDPGGQIWLKVSRDADAVLLSVRDTGIGISEEMLPRVFGLFTQIDRTANRGQGGLGIGLALVKSLIEMHEGTVEARSEGVGRGSEFLIRLPLVSSFSFSESSSKPVTRTVPLLSPRPILVVDDNRDAAESLGMLLNILGAEVHLAFNGPEALEAVEKYRPAVVLLDIGMPGMDGHEVARRIRQLPDFQDMKLIALTGWGQEGDLQRSHGAGFDHHLIKPADVNTLGSLLISLNQGQRVE